MRPSNEAVIRQLENTRKGTAATVPNEVRIGSPIRMLRVDQEQQDGARVQDMFEQAPVVHLYPVDSDLGAEAEFFFRQSSPAGFVGGGLSDGGHNTYDGFVAILGRLPRLGPTVQEGVVSDIRYICAVRWNGTKAVGVFSDAGLTGIDDSRSRDEPAVPIGVVLEDDELAEVLAIVFKRGSSQGSR